MRKYLSPFAKNHERKLGGESEEDSLRRDSAPDEATGRRYPGRKPAGASLKRGMSLVEILVGFTIMAVALLAANTMLFSSLSSARKAAAVALVNGEGNYALNSMTSMLRYATSITCVGGANPNRLDVVAADLETFYYDLNGSRIASVSAGGTRTMNLTSAKTVVSVPTGCSAMVACNGSPAQTVSICFAIEVAGAFDNTDRAGGTGGVEFRTQVTLRNHL